VSGEPRVSEGGVGCGKWGNVASCCAPETMKELPNITVKNDGTVLYLLAVNCGRHEFIYHWRRTCGCAGVRVCRRKYCEYCHR
jgi:hypothetical protein